MVKRKKTNMTILKNILRTREAQKIKGVFIDIQTANKILTVRANLKPTNRTKFTKLINRNITQASNIAWKL